MALTSSIFSVVAPPVITTFLPAKIGLLSLLMAASIITSGLAKAPLPTSPQARVLSTGSTTKAPFFFKISSEFCVAKCSIILLFAAGATTKGTCEAAISVCIKTLSQIPTVSLFIVFTEAGAMRTRSILE